MKKLLVLFFLAPLCALAQPFIIKGTVIGEDQKPIYGANVGLFNRPRRFMELIDKNRTATPSSIMHTLQTTCELWRGREVRRDDLSAMAFAI